MYLRMGKRPIIGVCWVNKMGFFIVSTAFYNYSSSSRSTISAATSAGTLVYYCCSAAHSWSLSGQSLLRLSKSASKSTFSNLPANFPLFSWLLSWEFLAESCSSSFSSSSFSASESSTLPTLAATLAGFSTWISSGSPWLYKSFVSCSLRSSLSSWSRASREF